MFYLPLYHDLRGAKCLVVGAGTTALRKIRWLLRAEAEVYVVAVKARDELQQMAKDGELTLQLGEFSDACITSDLRLIVSATNDTGINEHVYELAQQANVPVNCVDQPDLCTFIFPAIVDREPIIVAVSTGGSAPTLARMVRGWIEARLPPGLGRLAELGQRMRSRVRSALPDVDARKAFWERLFDSPVAERAMSGDLDIAETEAADMLTDTNQQAGCVVLVGAGPGDPELITLKALRAIQQADVILYDKLANPRLLDYARRDAEYIYVGKQGPKPGALPTRPDNRSNQQGSINDLIVEHGSAGKMVVRLKGGDPFIYGRGGEELEQALAAGLEVQVIPGITAGLGAASYAGIPLTYRNVSQSVRFVTGHRVENIINVDWPELGHPEQTLVIYMGLVGLPRILAKLTEHGCEPGRPAALVEHATLPEQRVIRGTVGNLAELVEEAGVSGPSVVIIGEVVGLLQENP